MHLLFLSWESLMHTFFVWPTSINTYIPCVEALNAAAHTERFQVHQHNYAPLLNSRN